MDRFNSSTVTNVDLHNLCVPSRLLNNKHLLTNKRSNLIRRKHCVKNRLLSVIDNSSSLATSSQPCPVGTARGGAFFDPGARYTQCKKCDWEKGEWQDRSGQPNCRQVSEGSIVGELYKFV